MNKLTKELVATYKFASTDADFYKAPVELYERINGFDYCARVPRTNITVVGNVYKLDPSDEQPNNYMLLCGVSYQDPDDYNPNDEQETEVAAIRAQVEKYVVEGDLRREVQMNIKNKMEINSYQGTRHKKGLPVHGQRTSRNARTRKGKGKTVANKKKISK